MYTSQFRIYIEDTDMMGIVYHANYLCFFERARTELLREHGISLAVLAEQDCQFAILSAELRYLAPARFDDLIFIDTSIKELKSCSILFEQLMRNAHNSALCKASIKVACVNRSNRPRRLPEAFRRIDIPC